MRGRLWLDCHLYMVAALAALWSHILSDAQETDSAPNFVIDKCTSFSAAGLLVPSQNPLRVSILSLCQNNKNGSRQVRPEL